MANEQQEPVTGLCNLLAPSAPATAEYQKAVSKFLTYEVRYQTEKNAELLEANAGLCVRIEILEDLVQRFAAEARIANQENEIKAEIITLQGEAIRCPEEADSLLARVRALQKK